MGVPINYWAVIVAAVVQMVLGFLWYGPLFGKTWATLMGFTPEKMNEQKTKGMTVNYIIMALGALLMSYVLAHGLIFGNTYLHMAGATSGLQGAFYYWLGFIVPVSLGTVLWEGKPWKLWFINAGYYLVGLGLMGMILSAWV
jgi:hypothetical protein